MSESSSRHCLYVANLIFLILALTTLAVGLWAHFDANFDDYVRKMHEKKSPCSLARFLACAFPGLFVRTLTIMRLSSIRFTDIHDSTIVHSMSARTSAPKRACELSDSPYMYALRDGVI